MAEVPLGFCWTGDGSGGSCGSLPPGDNQGEAKGWMKVRGDVQEVAEVTGGGQEILQGGRNLEVVEEPWSFWEDLAASFSRLEEDFRAKQQFPERHF